MSLFPPPAIPLPNFSTLLIAGPYHPSAPIHLALSSNIKNPEGRIVFFAPSRSTLKEDLQRVNDSWLTSHSGDGATSEVTSNVTILYPPTPAHLCLLLSMLRVSNNNNVDHNWANPQTVQAIAPSLVVFTELSSYFLASDAGGASVSSSPAFTIPSYLSLVNRILVSISNLKESSSDAIPKIAFFDSHLPEFKLPVMNQPSNLFSEGSSHHPQQIQILPLVEKLFEWVGIFEDDSFYIPSSQAEETASDEGIRRQLRLYQVGKEGDGEGQIINWTETLHLSASGSGLHETYFNGCIVR